MFSQKNKNLPDSKSITNQIYSYLNASIGFSLAALFAGYMPKNSPIQIEKVAEIKTAF